MVLSTYIHMSVVVDELNDGSQLAANTPTVFVFCSAVSVRAVGADNIYREGFSATSREPTLSDVLLLNNQSKRQYTI